MIFLRFQAAFFDEKGCQKGNKLKHLLIDFENVQPQNLDKLPETDTHIWLFLGVNQKNLSVELVKSLLRFGECVHLVQLQKSGKNALDFYLSYYLGQITTTDKNAMIGILSRDGGYDVLVEHILVEHQAQDIVRLASLNEVEEIAHIQSSETVVLAENQSEKLPETTEKVVTETVSLAPYFQAVFRALRQPNAFLPTRLHNLESNLRTHILRDMLENKNDDDRNKIVNEAINKLKTQKFITIDDERNTVQYHLSDSDILEKIQRYILNIKPKTYAEFQAAVSQRAADFDVRIEVGDIQGLARNMRERELIRQNNGKIEYAPFPNPPQAVAQTAKQPEKYQPNSEMWQKVLASLAVAHEKRPTRMASLKNVIKAHAKCSDGEVEKLFQHLQDKKIISLKNQKVIYTK